MEEKESEKLRKKELNKMNDKNGNIYFQFTNGLHYINKEYKTDIDSSMALDFTKYKTIWNINIGYSFTPRLFTTIDFAFIYTGEQKKINGITFNNNDGITVNGSGYGGAMIRYGLGNRFNSSFYFTGNIQYNLSKLKQPIGSVNAFTGLSINGGFGFTIPSKKKNN